MGKVIFWIIFAVVLFSIFMLLLTGWIIYSIILVRTSKKKWQRGPAWPDDPQYKALFAEGQAWREKNLAYKKDVHIKSGRLNLYGEYFDFGSRKAAIMIGGRGETCLYGDYFAQPYAACGYNCLTIDARAHGLSDGHFNSLGHHEAKDLVLWAKFLHDECGVEEVILHGVCIGSSVAAQAIVREDCPDYVTKIVGEGMYTRFYDTYLTHLKDQGHKPFPAGILTMIDLMICTGANPFREGPQDALPRLKKPVLMLHSREDIYSLPEKAEDLYEAISGVPKRIVWFDHGAHSKIRVLSEENQIKYDQAIKEFLEA